MSLDDNSTGRLLLEQPARNQCCRLTPHDSQLAQCAVQPVTHASMKAFWAVVKRDIKLATRIGGDAMTVLLFYVMVGAIMPFAIGPDKVLLSKLGPAIIWISALLSLLLALDRLFRTDHEDGSMLAMRQAHLPLEMIVVAKLLAH